MRCYDEDLTHLHLPSGILRTLESIIHEAGPRLDVEDARAAPDRTEMSLDEPLSRAQERAVRDILRHDEGGGPETCLAGLLQAGHIDVEGRAQNAPARGHLATRAYDLVSELRQQERANDSRKAS